MALEVVLSWGLRSNHANGGGAGETILIVRLRALTHAHLWGLHLAHAYRKILFLCFFLKVSCAPPLVPIALRPHTYTHAQGVMNRFNVDVRSVSFTHGESRRVAEPTIL